MLHARVGNMLPAHVGNFPAHFKFFLHVQEICFQHIFKFRKVMAYFSITFTLFSYLNENEFLMLLQGSA